MNVKAQNAKFQKHTQAGTKKGIFNYYIEFDLKVERRIPSKTVLSVARKQRNATCDSGEQKIASDSNTIVT